MQFQLNFFFCASLIIEMNVTKPTPTSHAPINPNIFATTPQSFVFSTTTPEQPMPVWSTPTFVYQASAPTPVGFETANKLPIPVMSTPFSFQNTASTQMPANSFVCNTEPKLNANEKMATHASSPSSASNVMLVSTVDSINPVDDVPVNKNSPTETSNQNQNPIPVMSTPFSFQNTASTQMPANSFVCNTEPKLNETEKMAAQASFPSSVSNLMSVSSVNSINPADDVPVNINSTTETSNQNPNCFANTTWQCVSMPRISTGSPWLHVSSPPVETVTGDDDTLSCDTSIYIIPSQPDVTAADNRTNLLNTPLDVKAATHNVANADDISLSDDDNSFHTGIGNLPSPLKIRFPDDQALQNEVSSGSVYPPAAWRRHPRRKRGLEEKPETDPKSKRPFGVLRVEKNQMKTQPSATNN
jgi:hypothetical protein